MRAYNIIISDPKTGNVWKPTPTGNGFVLSPGGSTFVSYINGVTLPGALDIEFDFLQYPFAVPQGASKVTIWGVGLGMINQATNLNGMDFKLYAGMQKGLPLANPAQFGLIMQGQVFQGFGNWQGVNQTLELIVNPGIARRGQDIFFNWPKNTPLKSALQMTFAQAFPKYPNPNINIDIGSALSFPYDQSGTYTDLAQFASMVRDLSLQAGRPVYGESYNGVDIVINGPSINVFDGTLPKQPKKLAFQDLVGQPTWIGAAAISFATVLRADYGVGDNILFPLGITAPFALTQQAAAVPNAPASSKTAFQGTFVIQDVHHFARYRQADAQSWNTTFTAVPLGNTG